MESIATEPRTTPAGLVLPPSMWTDECEQRSPYARAMPGAFPKFSAIPVVEWWGTSCDATERKCIAQRCEPYEGPRMMFWRNSEYGLRRVDEGGWPIS